MSVDDMKHNFDINMNFLYSLIVIKQMKKLKCVDHIHTYFISFLFLTVKLQQKVFVGSFLIKKYLTQMK